MAGGNAGLWCQGRTRFLVGMGVLRALREPSTGESLQLHLSPWLLGQPTQRGATAGTVAHTLPFFSRLITAAFENSQYPTGVKTSVVPVLGSSMVLNEWGSDQGRICVWGQ